MTYFYWQEKSTIYNSDGEETSNRLDIDYGYWHDLPAEERIHEDLEKQAYLDWNTEIFFDGESQGPKDMGGIYIGFEEDEETIYYAADHYDWKPMLCEIDSELVDIKKDEVYELKKFVLFEAGVQMVCVSQIIENSLYTSIRERYIRLEW